MTRITSMKHPLIQMARAANTDINSSHILLQDWAACRWALNANLNLKEIFVCEGHDQSAAIASELKKQGQIFHWTTSGMMQKIKQTKYVSPVAALCDPSSLMGDASGQLVILLDNLQDPGNIGTILRSARAFGVTHAAVIGDNALFHKKSISASRGHVFTGKYQSFDTAQEAADYYHDKGYLILRTAMDADFSLTDAAKKITQPIALVVGNETEGCNNAWMDYCDHSISIPMSDKVESLNVAAAASVCCYVFSQAT